MSQPVWKFLTNLGDANPLEHGGYFVYLDETGVYPPEAEYLEVLYESNDPRYKVYRFSLDKCTYQNGILSDNKFHPELPAWFAAPEAKKAERPQDRTYLSNVASYCGWEVEALIESLCSDDPVARAEAYDCVGEFHGFENFDNYPLDMRKRELRKRYKKQNNCSYS